MAAIYDDLAGKSVIVTGGGSGIGEAIVRSFARQGARVGIIDIKRDESLALVEILADTGQSVLFEQADITDIPALRSAIANLRAKLGAIEILINNAGNDERHATESVTPEYWDQRIAVNLKHYFFAAQAVLPDMKAAQSGVIINCGSTSWMAGVGGMPVYTAAKSAVVGLTRSLARDFGPFNIRVNAVAPGWTMTPRQMELWLTPQAEIDLLERQCLKRKLMPDDIARFITFLSSEEASACTSQHYVVDCGWI